MFHADGPAKEKARSPNLVLVRGTEKSEDDGRRPECDCVAGCTMLPRYAGQRPVTTACIKQHSLNWTSIRLRFDHRSTLIRLQLDRATTVRRPSLSPQAYLCVGCCTKTSCARGDTICPRPSAPPWAPKRLARRRADAT